MIGRAAVALLALAAAKDDPLAGRVAGPAQECLDLDRVQGPDIVDQTTILYRQNRQRIWRAELSAPCPALEPFASLIVEVHGRQLCRLDHFRVRTRSSRIPSGFCRFERFVPYDLPRAR